MPGLFVFGVVEDLVDGDYPRVGVRVSDRWVERVSVRSLSGISVGDRVRFRVRARAFQGPRGPFVSLSALDVSVSTADGWVDAESVGDLDFGGLE